MRKRVLLISCGDIGLRLAARLPEQDYQVHALRRDISALPAGIEGIQWDLNNSDGLAERIAGFDVVVITPVPNSRDEAGYRQAYETNIRAIVQALERPELVILVSSSRVYHQNQGEWVDENSPCQPADYRGKSLLAGEEILRQSRLPHCIVRFSGIYGPGRRWLLRQVQSGEWHAGDANYSNRIHSEDCAAVLAHLINAKVEGKTLADLYLASDCEPAPLYEVKRWLAAEQGLDFPPPGEMKAGGRRCSNRRLLSSGYRFIYPTFREGYAELVKEVS